MFRSALGSWGIDGRVDGEKLSLGPLLGENHLWGFVLYDPRLFVEAFIPTLVAGSWHAERRRRRDWGRQRPSFGGGSELHEFRTGTEQNALASRTREMYGLWAEVVYASNI